MTGERRRGFGFVVRPLWLLGHLAVAAAVVAMILLGHWQLTVSEHKGFSIQNFGYALQWWAFSGFAVLLWGKVLHDTAKTVPAGSSPPVAAPAAPVAYRRYVMPQSSDGPIEPGDETHAAYNAYLRSLDNS